MKVNHARTNFILRTVIWLGFLSWWIYLKLPQGSGLLQFRPGISTGVGLVLVAAGTALYVWAARALASAVPKIGRAHV